jgi:hypothetical protein
MLRTPCGHAYHVTASCNGGALAGPSFLAAPNLPEKTTGSAVADPKVDPRKDERLSIKAIARAIGG